MHGIARQTNLKKKLFFNLGHVILFRTNNFITIFLIYIYSICIYLCVCVISNSVDTLLLRSTSNHQIITSAMSNLFKTNTSLHKRAQYLHFQQITTNNRLACISMQSAIAFLIIKLNVCMLNWILIIYLLVIGIVIKNFKGNCWRTF